MGTLKVFIRAGRFRLNDDSPRVHSPLNEVARHGVRFPEAGDDDRFLRHHAGSHHRSVKATAQQRAGLTGHHTRA